MEKVSYVEKTVDELRALCKERSLSGYSDLDKKKLIRKLKAADRAAVKDPGIGEKIAQAILSKVTGAKVERKGAYIKLSDEKEKRAFAYLNPRKKNVQLQVLLPVEEIEKTLKPLATGKRMASVMTLENSDNLDSVVKVVQKSRDYKKEG